MANLYKILLLLFVLIAYSSMGLSTSYNVETSEIDRYICKNTSSSFYLNYGDIVDNKILDENSSIKFNESFIEIIERKQFDSYRGWGGVGLSYFVYKNGTEYKINTDGDWYSIRAKFSRKVDIKNFEKYYYGIFEQDLRDIKRALERGIESATGYNCVAGDHNHGLIRILNIYDYPVDYLKCKVDQNGVFLDCEDNSIIQSVLLSLWANISYHDRRGYLWGRNKIFADLDEFKFNRENDYDYITEPIIIFSESEFVSSLSSGQSIFVDHTKYLRDMQKIPIAITRIEKAISQIENQTNKIYDNLDLVKESWLSGKTAQTLDLIKNKKINVDVSKYLTDLGNWEGLYSDSTYLFNENSRIYYEDLYQDISNKYLSELNSELFIYRNKLNFLLQKQEFYETYTTSIISDINDQERTIEVIQWAIIALLTTVMLFLLDQILKRYGYEFIFYFLLILLLTSGLFFVLKWNVMWETILILFILIGFSTIIWLVFPNLVLLNYKNIFLFLFSKNPENRNLFFGLWYWININLLFSWYVMFQKNNELNYCSLCRNKIKSYLDRVLREKEEIAQRFQNGKLKKEELEHILDTYYKLKVKIDILTKNISALLNHTELTKADRQEFTGYKESLLGMEEMLTDFYQSKKKLSAQILKENFEFDDIVNKNGN